MKKVILTLMAVLAFSYSYGQDDVSKVQEAGINFTGLNSVGVFYRVGKSNAVWRFNVLSLHLTSSNSGGDANSNVQNNQGASISIGRESRTPLLVENLKLRVGADAFYNLHRLHSTTEDTGGTTTWSSTSLSNTVGIIGVLGFLYEISDDFNVGAELRPSIGYGFGTRTSKNFITNEIQEDKSSGLNFGISNILTMSLAYRF